MALPKRVPVRDGLHVDWHSHSRWSDGQGTIPELVEQAETRGVTLGISDHGLSDNARLRRPEQIEAYLADLARYPVLRGIEISIGEPSEDGEAAGTTSNGRGDWSQGGAVGTTEHETEGRGGLLGGFDYVIASLHAIRVPEGAIHSTRYLNWRAGLYPAYRPSVRRYARRRYFDALLRALDETTAHWPVTILGHFCLMPELANAQGTYTLAEDPCPDGEALDWLDAIIALCVRRDVAIELNSKSRAPHAGFVRRALELGARFSLGSDAHQRHRAGDLSYGHRLVEQIGIPVDRLLSVSDVPTARLAESVGARGAGRVVG